MSDARFAIYQGATKYVVHEFSQDRPGCWAVLGRDYTREAGQKLADALNQDDKDRKEDRRKRRQG